MTGDDIYSRDILSLVANIPRIGRLAAPDATVSASSRLCGSTLIVDLAIDGEAVTDFAMDIHACALGQAAASVVAANIVGSNAAELRDLRQTMQRMLTEDGPPPAGRFAQLALLEPVRDYKARHPAIMLIFDAVVAALEKAGALRPEAAETMPA